MSLSEVEPAIVASVADLYEPAVVPLQKARYERIRAAFVARFGSEPDFYARSPGRVNLIGEHIDYSGYSVLPMAIDRDVVIAVSSSVPAPGTAARVVLSNTEKERFPDREFSHEKDGYVTIDSAIHEWSNYFKCGYKGVFEGLGPTEARSFNALVDGTVPAGALTETAIRSEKYAGVQIGGMDQSISIMAAAGSALLIHFTPTLSASRISFPPSTEAPVFVIANTLVTADKHVTAPIQYNLRVVETRIAAALLAKHLKITGASTLRDVQDKWLGAAFEGRETQVLADINAIVDAAIEKEPYTREKAAKALGITVPELEEKFVGKIVIRADAFDLYKRTKHVFEEARRVFLFRDVCELKAPYSGDLLKDLGALMNASQDSCRAGWGGCTVSLVAESKVAEFIAKVKEAYYFKRWPQWKGDAVAEKKMEDFIFASKPGSGATVVKGI
ncbi:ribosomal protein S5 domain 2-type protein [Blyttiomyces helicus]|uniref:Ribosomal protein S5 domain 2-type protein n=1 Tax=Blyttiomyces helicus TaxID=388810 RepID=A0A4P9W396_9FUNG|nr:ribosomal protein S5 domain 2-type protein [Blyttiomyces helicus]|eukprot:RKO86779.1 ribosomal protein S5 domain 2-type protein [Blyttiomyces helicus]